MTANLKTLLKPIKKNIDKAAEINGGLFLRGSEVSVTPEDANYEFRELLSDPVPLAIGTSKFQHRREQGARCYGLYYQGNLMSSGWVSGPGSVITVLHEMTLAVPQDAVYIWDCRTVPEARGCGHFQRLLRQISRAQAPDTRVLVAVDWRNRASRAALEKAGFRALFSYWELRLVGRSAAGVAVKSWRLMNAQKAFDNV